MNKVQTNIVRVAYWCLLVALIVTCAFFIVHNASWLVGDDAIVMRHTGFGNPFKPGDSIFRESGRFFPFTYLMYNVLLLFGSDFIPAAAHYSLHALCYILCILNYTLLALMLLKNAKPVLKYSMSLCIAIIITGRTMPNFVECYSTVWFGYFLGSLFVICAYLLHEQQKFLWLIVAILIINFSNFRGETVFITPLAMGICALLFFRKSLTQREIWFYSILVASAVVFLLIYATTVLPFIETKYDGSHGSNVSLIGNAAKILFAQKIILLSIPFGLYRLWFLLKLKDQFGFWDNLYLTALAACCGGFILKLNWVLYYNSAAIYCLFFILNTMQSAKWRAAYIAVVIAVFTVLYGMKIIPTIKNSQAKRTDQPTAVLALAEKISNSNACWFNPGENAENHTISVVKKDWLDTQIAWYNKDKAFSLPSIKSFEICDIPEVVGLAIEDKEFVQSSFSELDDSKIIFFENGILVYAL